MENKGWHTKGGIQVKKTLSIVLSLGLFLGISSGFGITEQVEAKSTIKAKTYSNCTELNKKYKGGVAKTSKTKNKGGKTKYTPHVSKELYLANQSKDRDKDNIACER